MKFTTYSALWNPRPEDTISRDRFEYFRHLGWIVQAKKNGTGSQVGVSPDKTLTWRTRYNVPHKDWAAPVESEHAFVSLPGSGWHVFSTELLNAKVAASKGGIRNVNYIHDILVYDGEFLLGTTYSERYDLMKSLFLKGNENETPSHFVIDKNTWLAKIHDGDFNAFMDTLTTAEDEGVVLKNPLEPLAFCTRIGANTHWQKKSRHTTRNFHN